MKKKSEAIPAWAGGTLYDLIDIRTDLSPQAYCLRFGESQDWDEMKARITERRRTMSAWWWWGCACGYTEKRRGDDNKERTCPKCKAVIRNFSRTEADSAQKVQDEAMKKITEKTFRAGLYERNHVRQLEGLSPLTESEYRQERRKEAELAARRSRG